MERGPMALFGAIVAVGLGPALWLGVQIGDVNITPAKPPVVQSDERVDPGKIPGGEGAGAEPDQPAEVIPQPKRKARYSPLTAAPTVDPSAGATGDAEGEEPGSPSDSAEPTPTDEQTTPPIEDTTEPTEPSDDDDPAPPAPDDPGEGGAGAGVEQPQS